MKANPNPELLKAIFHSDKKYDIGIDVASIGEMQMALQYVSKNDIIYTNPHTIPYEKDDFMKMGIKTKVVDSLGELYKLREYDGLNTDILIRLKSNIHMANCSFDSKFGCSQEVAIQIISYAKNYGFRICGISFHIGSGGKFDRKIAYQTALAYAKPILDKIENPIVDIGGGLLHDTDLVEALGWTKGLPYRFIAEPGRFIAEPAYHLAIQVIAVTNRGVFLDNGIYHELNVYYRDHWTFPKLSYIYDTDKQTIQKINDFKFVDIFGPTCDSYDMIPSVIFPEHYIASGDWIFLPNMGAYTSSASVDFNGIKSAASSYVDK